MSAPTTETLVRQFQRDFGHPVAAAPALIPIKRANLRHAMTQEEVNELAEAIDAGDLVEIADALADIVWLAYGAAAEYGITLDPVLQEVARSNASKLGDDGLPIIAGANDPDGFPEGKIKKGPNYQPPAIAPILEAQGVDPMTATAITDADAEIALMDAARIREVKAELAASLESETNVRASTREHAKDIHVSGPLSEIWEWAQQWRSEIEELG